MSIVHIRIGVSVSKCCICGKPIKKSPQDPWPIDYDEDARCCSNCYIMKVLPEIVKKRQYLEKHNLTGFVDAQFVEE